MRILVLFGGSVLLAVSMLLPAAQAAEGYDNCTGFIDALPATISGEGIWCLRKDLSTAITSGSAIYVSSSNVTIDCNNHKVGGLGAGTATQTNGIALFSGTNLTVRRCNIRGFMTGILVSGARNQGVHVIEDNRLEGNTVYGIIAMGAKGSTIRRNMVLDTGGSAWQTSGGAFAIDASNGVSVIDNTISGVAQTPDANGDASAYGILATSNADGIVRGNRVRGLVSQGAGASYGVLNSQSFPTTVRANDVSGTGAANSFGISCYNSPTVAVGNVVNGFETPLSGCPGSDNTLNTN